MREPTQKPLAGLSLGLLRTSFINGAGVLLLAAAALLRDTTILRTFGLGAVTDGFFLALLIPTQLGSVLSSAFASALIPAYFKAEADDGGGDAAVGLLSAANLVICLVCAGALLMVSPWIAPALAHNYAAPIRHQLFSLFGVFIVLVALVPMAATWAAALQARQRFFIAAAAPIAAPLLCAAAAVFGGQALGMQGIGVALVLGAAVQAAVLAASVRRSGVRVPPWQVWRHLVRCVRATPATWLALRQYPPLVLGNLLQSGLTIIPQLAAAWLATGAVTALSLGARMTTLGMAVIGTGVSVSALPALSALSARADWPQFQARLRFYSAAALVLSVPAALGLFVLSEPIAALLYGHGATTHAQIAEIAKLQALYGLQIPIQIVGIVWVRALTAMNENRRLVQIAAVNLVLSVVCTVGLAKLFGVAGVALAPTLVYLGSGAQIIWIVSQNLRTRLRSTTPAEPPVDATAAEAGA